MGISVIGAAASSGGGGGTNNFVLKTTAETTYVLDRTYTSGRYSLSFLDSDTTFDIYAIAEDGTYAGYTASTSLEVSADFAEIVVLGAASGTRISFTHLGVLTESVTSGDVATAGAFVSSVVTSSLPSVDDTTVVNGGNFAANVAVSFIDQSAVETAAKTVVRSSSTQLLVTRPDAFSPDDSPYTVKVVNPGIPVPAGTNAHLLSNSVTAGTNPVWTTGTAVVYNVSVATSVTLLATDTEATDIDYSIVSGTLPAGLALDGETGVISGTASGSPAEGDVTAVTIRAIDTGGNFLDKAFNFTANAAPAWVTASDALTASPVSVGYSYVLDASNSVSGVTTSFAITAGALPAGLAFNSATGEISGTNSGTAGETSVFTVTATDSEGQASSREFSLETILALSNAEIVIFGGGATSYAQSAGGSVVHATGQTISSSGTVTVGAAQANSTLTYVPASGSAETLTASAGLQAPNTVVTSQSTQSLNGGTTTFTYRNAYGASCDYTLNGVTTTRTGGQGSDHNYTGESGFYGYGSGTGGGASPGSNGGNGNLGFGACYVSPSAGSGANGWTSPISGKQIGSGAGGWSGGQAYQWGGRCVYNGNGSGSNGSGATGANSGCAGSGHGSPRSAGSGGFELRYSNSQPQLTSTTGSVSYTNAGGYHQYLWNSSGGFTV